MAGDDASALHKIAIFFLPSCLLEVMMTNIFFFVRLFHLHLTLWEERGISLFSFLSLSPQVCFDWLDRQKWSPTPPYSSLHSFLQNPFFLLYFPPPSPLAPNGNGGWQQKRLPSCIGEKSDARRKGEKRQGCQIMVCLHKNIPRVTKPKVKVALNHKDFEKPNISIHLISPRDPKHWQPWRGRETPWKKIKPLQGWPLRFCSPPLLPHEHSSFLIIDTCQTTDVNCSYNLLFLSKKKKKRNLARSPDDLVKETLRKIFLNCTVISRYLLWHMPSLNIDCTV